MSLLKKETVLNGDLQIPHFIYKCDRCGSEIPEEWGVHSGYQENEHFCHECAFRVGLVDGKWYGNWFGCMDYNYAGINPHSGEIEFVKAKYYKSGKKKDLLRSRGKFTWEMTDREFRNCRYYHWLKERIYNRDSYTCQDCGKSSDETKLNIHHIKPFAKFLGRRLDDDNCVTLCVKCHRRRHREGDLDGSAFKNRT